MANSGLGAICVLLRILLLTTMTKRSFKGWRLPACAGGGGCYFKREERCLCNGIPALRAANWSQCSLYPASNQKATSKLTAKPKNSKTFHPDEAPEPRLPDSIVRPIAIMPLSRMENTTFVMPSIIDYHDMGLRTVFTVRTPKGKRLFNAFVTEETERKGEGF
ncbi:hypothetical protein TNCV_4494111 [Trichonephila clavipes]|nr:hypothetical protein TNCV_4494111 [Trichonephila clavipes]